MNRYISNRYIMCDMNILKRNALKSKDDFYLQHYYYIVNDFIVTICLICIKNYPNNIYAFVSDDKDGVYNKFAINHEYDCLQDNLLVGTHIEDLKCCSLFEPKYLKIDPKTGRSFNIYHTIGELNSLLSKLIIE